MAFVRSLIILSCAVAFIVLASPDPAWAQEPEFEPGAVLVRWGNSVRAQESVQALGAQAVGSIPELGITKLQVPPGKEQETIAALKRAGAEIAEPNYRRWAAYVPDDPMYTSQWAMDKLSLGPAWDISEGVSSVIVAVIDTGIDVTHPDRPQNLILGADYIADASGNVMVSSDPQGHGTHVAGTIAAHMDNAAGVAGVAPGVSLMAIRVLDASGSGDTDTTARGMVYAADHGAKVINLSLSGFGTSSAEQSAVTYAHNKGVLIVAAAGNCYKGGADCDYLTNPVMYPAALANVVAVAATGMDDSHASYSETGSYVDLAAPGGGATSYNDQILSTCMGGGYCRKAGTSMASPHVAAVAALLFSINSSLTPDQVETILRQTATDLGAAGRDDIFGYGRVNALGAVQQALATTGGYQAQNVSQIFPNDLKIGQRFTATVEIKNTGTQTWYRDGVNPVRLATSQPQNRTSPFYTAGSWVAPDRPASLIQASVAPGGTGRFTFVITGPASGGTFTEYYQVVAENKAWMTGPLVSVRIPVWMPNLTRLLYVPVLCAQAVAW